MRPEKIRWLLSLCSLGVIYTSACGEGSDVSAPSKSAEVGQPPAAESGDRANPTPVTTPSGSTPTGAAGAAASSNGPSPAMTPPASSVPTTPKAAPPVAAATGSASAAGSAAPAVPPPRATATDREKYPMLKAQPFVLAAHDPFSTFAADVDTASYDLFRRNLEHNLPPTPESVRIEDFVNYFKYDYSAPEAGGEHPFKVSLAATQNAFGRDTVLVRVGIQAKNAPSEKKPANLVFLVDTSGSMAAEDKLPLVQFLAKRALDLLGPEDKISIVTYSEQAIAQLEPTPVAKKAEITAVIDRLSASGSTNGAGGIQLAYEKAQAAFIEGGINHVIMATDGDFNVGISDPEQLVKFIEDKRKSGITLTALGFGLGNLNDALMERVSNAGNGIYSLITSQEQASRYAEERLLATILHVAKDLKIQLEWNPAEVEAYRLIGYEDRAIADQSFRDDKIDAGEIGAGHRVTALYEVVRKGGKVPQPEGAPAAEGGDAVEGDREIGQGDLVQVKIRYKAPGASESDAAKELSQSLKPGDIGASFDAADKDMRWAAAIAAYAEIVRKSPYALPNARDQLRTIFADQAARDFARTEFLKLYDIEKGQPQR